MDYKISVRVCVYARQQFIVRNLEVVQEGDFLRL